MGWKPSPDLVYGLAAPWMGSWRYHRYHTEGFAAGCRLSRTGTVILILWHQSLLGLIGSFQHHPSMKLAALASRSGDGQIISDVLQRLGIRPVRGSSARGAAAGAKALMEALEEGCHLAIAIDGPKGPAQVIRPGPLELARKFRVPVLPVVARATRELRFRSWDRFRLPWPRAHIAMAFGQPTLYPEAEPGPEELERRRIALGRQLVALEADCARRVGQPDPWPRRERIAWLG